MTSHSKQFSAHSVRLIVLYWRFIACHNVSIKIPWTVHFCAYLKAPPVHQSRDLDKNIPNLHFLRKIHKKLLKLNMHVFLASVSAGSQFERNLKCIFGAIPGLHYLRIEIPLHNYHMPNNTVSQTTITAGVKTIWQEFQ